MTTYVFNGTPPHSRVKRASAQQIGEALEAIRIGHGGELSPRDVVEEARGQTSPLHSFFEWDDKKAAAQYRVDQARALIRSIRVVDEEDRRRPAFLNLRGDDGCAYHAIAEILSSADLRRRLLEQAERDLNAWQARYKELAEIVSLVEPAKHELRRRIEPSGEEARP